MMLKCYLQLKEVDFQLITPNFHIQNAAERAILTLKRILCGTDSKCFAPSLGPPDDTSPAETQPLINAAHQLMIIRKRLDQCNF